LSFQTKNTHFIQTSMYKFSFLTSIKIYILLIISILSANKIFAQKDLNLDFEIVARDGNFPVEWKSSGAHTGFLDEKIKKHGVNSVRLQLAEGSNSNDNSYYSQVLILNDKQGKEIVFRGYIKTENVGSAGLFVHTQTGTYFNLETEMMDKMDGRRLSGTNDWTPIILRTHFPANLYQIEFGAYIVGKGKVWIDDLKLTIDNQPYQLVPQRSADQSGEQTKNKTEKQTTAPKSSQTAKNKSKQ
jgi:hypothetical protein